MRMGTLEPLSGLTMDKDDNNCTTTSQAVVQAAAKASVQWRKPEDTTEDRWVRAGDR